jgi:hypothetical protein
MRLLDSAVQTKSMAHSGSIPVIENCTPIFRNGWEADIPSSRLNVANAPGTDISFTPLFCHSKGATTCACAQRRKAS